MLSDYVVLQLVGFDLLGLQPQYYAYQRYLLELQEQLERGLLEDTPELQLFLLLLKELQERTLPAEEQGPLRPPFRSTSFSELSFLALSSNSLTLALLAQSSFLSLSSSAVFFLTALRTWLSSFSTSSPFFLAMTSFSVVSSPQIFLWSCASSFLRSACCSSWSATLFFQSTSSRLAVSMFSLSCLVRSIAASISMLAFFFSTCSSSRASLAFRISFSDLCWSISFSLEWFLAFFLSQLMEKELSDLEVSLRADARAASSSTRSWEQMSRSSLISSLRYLGARDRGQWYFWSLVMQVKIRQRLFDFEGTLLALAVEDFCLRFCRSCEERTSTQQLMSFCSKARIIRPQNSSKASMWPVLVVISSSASWLKTPSHQPRPNFSTRCSLTSLSTTKLTVQSHRTLL